MSALILNLHLVPDDKKRTFFFGLRGGSTFEEKKQDGIGRGTGDERRPWGKVVSSKNNMISKISSLTCTAF